MQSGIYLRGPARIHFIQAFPDRFPLLPAVSHGLRRGLFSFALRARHVAPFANRPTAVGDAILLHTLHLMHWGAIPPNESSRPSAARCATVAVRRCWERAARPWTSA